MFSPRRPASLSRGPFSTPRLAIPERLMAAPAGPAPPPGDYLLRACAATCGTRGRGWGGGYSRPGRGGGLLEAVRTVLASLPDPFDRNDVCEALGYEPDRSSLFRVLQELQRDGELALDSRGAGNLPALYRKPGSSDPQSGA